MILLFVALLGSAVQAAPQTLLTYSAYFQAGKSDLTIFKDGTIAHAETVCCPPTPHTIKEVKLSADELRNLNAILKKVDDDSNLRPVQKKNVEFGLGYKNGTLTSYYSSKPLVVEDLARYKPDRGDILYRAHSAELLNFLYGLHLTLGNHLEIFTAAK